MMSRSKGESRRAARTPKCLAVGPLLGGLWAVLALACNAECLRHSDCPSAYVCWAGLCSYPRTEDAGVGAQSVEPRTAAEQRFNSQNNGSSASQGGTAGQGGTEPTLPTLDLDAGATDAGR